MLLRQYIFSEISIPFFTDDRPKTYAYMPPAKKRICIPILKAFACKCFTKNENISDSPTSIRVQTRYWSFCS